MRFCRERFVREAQSLYGHEADDRGEGIEGLEGREVGKMTDAEFSYERCPVL